MKKKKKNTTSRRKNKEGRHAPCFEVEGEVAVEARQAGDHAPGGGGDGGGEGGDHQEAEASKRVQEAAWPCRRRHLVDVLAAELQLPSQMGATYNDGSTGWTN